MTLSDLYAELQSACQASGGQSAWAKRNGLSVSYVSDVLNARVAPGPKILAALHLVARTTYHRSNKV